MSSSGRDTHGQLSAPTLAPGHSSPTYTLLHPTRAAPIARKTPPSCYLSYRVTNPITWTSKTNLVSVHHAPRFTAWRGSTAQWIDEVTSELEELEYMRSPLLRQEKEYPSRRKRPRPRKDDDSDVVYASDHLDTWEKMGRGVVNLLRARLASEQAANAKAKSVPVQSRPTSHDQTDSKDQEKASQAYSTAEKFAGTKLPGTAKDTANMNVLIVRGRPYTLTRLDRRRRVLDKFVLDERWERMVYDMGVEDDAISTTGGTENSNTNTETIKASAEQPMTSDVEAVPSDTDEAVLLESLGVLTVIPGLNPNVPESSATTTGASSDPEWQIPGSTIVTDPVTAIAFALASTFLQKASAIQMDDWPELRESGNLERRVQEWNVEQ